MPIQFNQSEIESLQKLIHALLMAHESKDYSALLKLSGENPENPQQPLLSEEEFLEASTTIANKFGKMKELQFIDALDKGNLIQSLWKVIYEGTPLEILWQIYFMRKGQTLRIVALWYN